MQENAKRPMNSGNLGLHKVKWLESVGLADDKSVIDCDPIALTVDYQLKSGEIVKRTVPQIWTRVMGYHRPVDHFNPGKQAEYKERVPFEESKVCLENSHIDD